MCDQIIIKVRFECTKCANYHLCDACEMAYSHEHFLIKIRETDSI